MRPFLIILCVGFCCSGHCQQYDRYVARALWKYTKKEYKAATRLFKNAFRLQRNRANDLYMAACAATHAGKDSLALYWIYQAMDAGWARPEQLKQEPAFYTWHHSEVWAQLMHDIQSAKERVEAGYNKPLQHVLLSIYEEDQGIRQQYILEQQQSGMQGIRMDSLSKRMQFIDSVNLLKVKEIITRYGWVGPLEVGDKANQVLFLVIQHADLPTQQTYLPIMRQAVQSGKAKPSALALLEDRVALDEGRRQIYGSQIGYDKDLQINYVLPLADPVHVDKRRAGVGLGSMAQYCMQWNIIWNARDYKKKLPAIEAKGRAQH